MICGIRRAIVNDYFHSLGQKVSLHVQYSIHDTEELFINVYDVGIGIFIQVTPGAELAVFITLREILNQSSWSCQSYGTLQQDLFWYHL